MPKFSRKNVRERADWKCEYCQLSEKDSVLPHELDHIRARKHRGPTTMQNTCVACAQCNGTKGSDVTSYDTETDELVPLFNPRIEDWTDHFFWIGPVLHGKTPRGRATIELSRIARADLTDALRVTSAIRALNRIRHGVRGRNRRCGGLATRLPAWLE